MLSENRYGRLAFKIISVLFLIAMGVCFITDFAINRRLLWAFYPVGSLLLAWLIFLPLFLIKKHKIVFSLAVLTVAVFPYLYFLERITPIKNWFYPLALPLAIASAVVTWIVFILFRYTKISIWYKSAAALVLYGVFFSSFTRYQIADFLGESFFRRIFSLDAVINILSCLAIAVLAIVIGRQKSERLKDGKLEMKDIN